MLTCVVIQVGRGVAFVLVRNVNPFKLPVTDFIFFGRTRRG